jgi:hypothetical protein
MKSRIKAKSSSVHSFRAASRHPAMEQRSLTHRAPRRARASSHGWLCTRPVRRSSRRLRSSDRQAEESAGSSAVSKLPINAAATAERSCAGSRNTSSSKWSTRPFMCASLPANSTRRRLTGLSRGCATARQPGRAPHRPIMRRTAGPPCCHGAPFDSALGNAIDSIGGYAANCPTHSKSPAQPRSGRLLDMPVHSASQERSLRPCEHLLPRGAVAPPAAT